MASIVEDLLKSFDLVMKEPWSPSLSGQERIWFLVYDPAEQRKVDLRMGDFENCVKRANKKWVTISLKNCFPSWIANHEYRDEYFADPEALVDQLDAEFKQYAIKFLCDELANANADENTLSAVTGVSSLFGFTRLSDVLSGCSTAFKGRLLIFFPGEYQKNHYRLLDARDGWSYLARPIIG